MIIVINVHATNTSNKLSVFNLAQVCLERNLMHSVQQTCSKPRGSFDK